jgi:hypothetical protein
MLPFEPRSELLRPWKILTLFLGIALLVVGSLFYEAPDWDVPISMIMAAIAYLTAPWSMRVIVERKWMLWPQMLVTTWFAVDGCYWIYWNWRDPVALAMMREANAPASLSLYWMCGLVWYHHGTVHEFLAEASRLWSNTRRWW